MRIIGAQLYIWAEELLNIHPDENERIFGVVPDKILVNGPYYLPEKSRLNYSVGPALRYRYLFDVIALRSNRKQKLVILPYFDHEIRMILHMIGKAAKEKSSEIIFHIKFHPVTNIRRYEGLIPAGAVVTEEDLSRLFMDTEVVIGAASGAFAEAIALGIPAIIIKNKRQYQFSYLPDLGKGVVWDMVESESEFIRLLNRFETQDPVLNAGIASISKQYRKMLFCEPTEERIEKAFEIC